MFKPNQKIIASRTFDQIVDKKTPAICIQPIEGGEFIWVSFKEVESKRDVIDIVSASFGSSSLADFIVSSTHNISDRICDRYRSVSDYLEVIYTYKANYSSDWEKLGAYLALGGDFECIESTMVEAINSCHARYTQEQVEHGWGDRRGLDRALFRYTMDMALEGKYFGEIAEKVRSLLCFDKCHVYIQQDYMPVKYGDDYFIFYVGQ